MTQEEARAALEAGNRNKLTAGQMPENEKPRKAQEIEEVMSNCETAAAQAVADGGVSFPVGAVCCRSRSASLYQRWTVFSRKK